MKLPTIDAQVGHYEFEIVIQASRERVWQILTEDTNSWWLPPFHVTGEDSTLSLDARAGGTLVETHPSGSSLLWYTVLMVTPGESLYMVGHSHADWAGPSVTWLKISLEESEGATVLRFRDDLLGRIEEKTTAALHEGWTTLFRDGLKAVAER